MAKKELENVEENSVQSRSGNIENNGKKAKKKSSLADKIISIIILLVCSAGLIYSGSKLYTWVLNNIKTNNVHTEINALAGIPDISKDENPGAEFGIDFAALLAYNPDVVGWIRIPGTTINYSLVQGRNNNEYLRHSIDHSYNDFGWPFMDAKNSPDFSDRNTILYGHNIVSGWMFADLLHIYTGVLGTDVEIDIYKPNYRLLRYKVFSSYIIDPTQDYLKATFESDELYGTFLSTMQSRSAINFNQQVGVDDKILTLQTCTSDVKQRVIVHAKLVSEEDMPR